MPLWAISTVLFPRKSAALDTGAALDAGKAGTAGGATRDVSSRPAALLGGPDGDGADGSGLGLMCGGRWFNISAKFS